jgi:hypothetical protein
VLSTGGVSTICGWPAAGGGGVRSLAGSFGGVVCWKSTWSKLTRPVCSMTVMWSSTVALAWSARARTTLFSVVERIFAIVLKIEPCVTRRMLAKSVSNCLPWSPASCLTKPCCWGLAWFGIVMLSIVLILRQLVSSAACPSIRCLLAVRTALDCPFFRPSWPTGYSHRPAARTLTTKSRSASVSGPHWVCAMTRVPELEVVLTPSIAGYASAASVTLRAPPTKRVPIAFREKRTVPPARSGIPPAKGGLGRWGVRIGPGRRTF